MPERTHAAHEGRGGTIMVIDDDPEMRAVLRDVLTHEGFRVHEESGPEQVPAVVDVLHPAAVIVDKEMPGSNGLDLVATLGHRYPELPVIVITAFGGAAIRAEARRQGAADYLEKPFRMATLLDALRALTLDRTPLETHDV
ncbi:MAG TPA: response regulator [Verrucomicrobiae bacterium]|nr:response regulator [Verrucomicrobiae bacterium]